MVLVVKSLPANAGDLRDADPIPESGRSPGGGHGNPFQYSCLENLMNRGAWWATVRGVTKSQTGLSERAQHTAHAVEHNQAATRRKHYRCHCSGRWKIPNTQWPQNRINAEGYAFSQNYPEALFFLELINAHFDWPGLNSFRKSECSS